MSGLQRLEIYRWMKIRHRDIEKGPIPVDYTFYDRLKENIREVNEAIGLGFVDPGKQGVLLFQGRQVIGVPETELPFAEEV